MAQEVESNVSPAAPARRPRFDYGVPSDQAEQVRVAVADIPQSGWLSVALRRDAAGASLRRAALAAGVFLGAYLLLFRVNLVQLVSVWYQDASWSHGFVVPALSAYFIRLQWPVLRRLPARGSYVGLLILALGVIGQVLFRATGTAHMSHLSMLVVLLGTALFVLGWEHMKLLWLPVSYLVFMINPPSMLYQKLTMPMQIIAAEVGVKLLPLFGTVGEREATQIRVQTALGWEKLNVAEACSGMRMLIAFVALAVALAYTTSRPMWQKVFLALCSLPVAILCNALRVAITGKMVAVGGQQWAEGATHEYIGLLMLFPALCMQMAIGWVLDRIFVEVDETPAAGGGAVS